MANKRASISMTDSEIAAYLEEQTILNIASIGPTGHPHMVAMWYVVMDEKVTFWTFGKSQKIVNLRRDKKITGLVESGDTYDQLKGLELVGSATIVEDYDTVLAIGKAVGLKYNGDGAISDAALPFLEAQAKKRLGIQINVEQIVSWDHTKIGGGY
ncbi:MAG: pyridoxamine 5'-phosphate oxidase [Actinobacteria bacterium]|jgi:general stress protein 26|nr:pyridoxamine 5'-phosphate oxidase [Actinomycetota bacterium]MSZ99958.1 pyridoxamine 5'-phosphate oxidase [Actinomycetota bacterium]MTA10585.1 pyridoxamine 5'-phosphate oxidase [Actinomycetota bacterium]